MTRAAPSPTKAQYLGYNIFKRFSKYCFFKNVQICSGKAQTKKGSSSTQFSSASVLSATT
jgi:hypothetical protein